MGTAGIALITGGGSGIGRALARSLTGTGWSVALVGRRKATLLETVDRCVAAGASPDRCHAIACDLADRSAAGHAVDETVRVYGGIDALVNNAAVARFAPLPDADLDDLEWMLRVNVLAPAALTQRALPHLRRRRGVVVNVGSIGGLLALPGRAGYGASKAALHHLTRSLARELAPDVRVNAVVPGAVDTDMYAHLDLPGDRVEELRQGLVGTTPLGRMATAEEIVPWIEHLLGPAGRWTTGSLLVVDGGRSC